MCARRWQLLGWVDYVLRWLTQVCQTTGPNPNVREETFVVYESSDWTTLTNNNA